MHKFFSHLPINLGNGLPVAVLFMAVIALMTVRVFQSLFLHATPQELRRADIWTLGLLVLFVVLIVLRFLAYAYA